MSGERDSGETKESGYGYRPSLLGAGWEFNLTPSAFAWSIGRRAGNVAYANISKVQLVFRPGTMQNGTFVAYIWSDGNPKITISSATWKSMVEVARQDAPYRQFIVALHRHLIEAGARTQFVRGVAPYVYWPGMVVFAGCAFGFALLILRALQTSAWAAAAFIAAFLAFFLWQLGGYFRRNRPGHYRADDVPRDLLPPG